jgi:hypothetical protein
MQWSPVRSTPVAGRSADRITCDHRQPGVFRVRQIDTVRRAIREGNRRTLSRAASQVEHHSTMLCRLDLRSQSIRVFVCVADHQCRHLQRRLPDAQVLQRRVCLKIAGDQRRGPGIVDGRKAIGSRMPATTITRPIDADSQSCSRNRATRPGPPIAFPPARKHQAAVGAWR